MEPLEIYTRGIWKCWPSIFEWMENKNGAFREPKWSLGAVWLIAAGAYPGFYSMKRLGVFLLPLDRMLVHRRSISSNLLGFPINLAVPIYIPGWREALWELNVLPKNTTQCPWPGLKPEPLTLGRSTLTIRPLRLPLSYMTNIVYG